MVSVQKGLVVSTCCIHQANSARNLHHQCCKTCAFTKPQIIADHDSNYNTGISPSCRIGHSRTWTLFIFHLLFSSFANADMLLCISQLEIKSRVVSMGGLQGLIKSNSPQLISYLVYIKDFFSLSVKSANKLIFSSSPSSIEFSSSVSFKAFLLFSTVQTNQ